MPSYWNLSCAYVKHLVYLPETIDISGASQGHDASHSKSLSLASEGGTFVEVPVDATSEETDVPSNVLEDHSDPDMLVLGFQELDLSTEALLYSTKTVREDAWCVALFAGLGEKAVLYEKVGARSSCRVFAVGPPCDPALMLFLRMAQLVSKQLVGMLLVIVIKKRLHACFSEIMTSSAGAGIMGIMVCFICYRLWERVSRCV